MNFPMAAAVTSACRRWSASGLRRRTCTTTQSESLPAIRLWPDKRLGLGSIYRTTQVSWLHLDDSYLPWPAFAFLKFTGFAAPDQSGLLQVGPIPRGTPVNLIANIDLEPSLNPMKIFSYWKMATKLHGVLRDIRDNRLDE